jgi:alpha-tubulin suppressor-like RCC1 family protein
MPELEMDAMFERRLAQRLGDFGSEAVRPFDAVQIAAIAAASSGGPGLGARLSALMPRGLRLVIATALLALGLIGAGVLGGLIKLPTNLTPDPTFQPFSPLPVATTPLETPDSTASALLTIGASPSAVVTGPPLTSPTPEPSPSETPTPSPTATPTASPTPSPDPLTMPVENVVAVTTGDTHACALADDGRVFCWGENDQGQLGDGTTEYRNFGTVPVVGIADARAIAAGIRFSCAVISDGSVWCWGEDPGSDGTSTVPVKVPGIDDAQFLAAGGAFVCALRDTHQVVCWGNNALGQLGTGTFGGPDQATPQPVDGLSDAVEIAAGWNHACAIRFDRRVWCWGGNGDGATGYGQLGDGTLQNRASPVEVVGLGDTIGIAAGGWTTCATPVDDSVWCWGYGERGTLGDGNFSNSSVPIQVPGLDNVGLLALGDFTACASRVDDSVWCWGDTSWGSSTGGPAGTPVEGNKPSSISVGALVNDRYCLFIDGFEQAWWWGTGTNQTPQPWPVGP